MATIKINKFRARQFGGASPFGNLTTLPFKLETSATGAAATRAGATASTAGGVAGTTASGVETVLKAI